jgi:prevent-host-death family protein
MNGANTISISNLRQNTANVVNKIAKSKEPKIILQRSKPKAVLVDVDYFEALEEMLLDLTDSNEAEKAKGERSEKFDKYINKRWGGL